MGDHCGYSEYQVSFCGLHINQKLTPLGCGKSVMARYLAANATTSIVLTHFFQSSVDRNSSRATPLVISILSQILKSNIARSQSDLEQVRTKVVPLLDHFSCGQDCPFMRLWPVLESILSSMPDYTLIIDALDECNDPENNDSLIKRLRLLGSKTNSRVIILSRFHAKFEAPLGECVKLAMDSSAVSADIMHFARQEISRNCRLQTLQTRILAKIEDSSQGMFLWAKLMLDDLSGARNINSQAHRLAGFPRGLECVYTEYLRKGTETMQPDEIGLRREILAILVGAVRPLTVDELSWAIALQPSRQLDENDMLFDPKHEILRLCWPLATANGDFVQLTHTSVKEFLLYPSDTVTETQGRLGLTFQESNAYLAQKCLSKLSQEECGALHSIGALIHRNAFSSTAIGAENFECYKTTAFYEYASLSWHLHLTSVQEPSFDLLIQLRDFLQSNYFVYWAEVMYELKSQVDMGPVLEVRALIQSWLARLPSGFSQSALAESYFSAPYESVHQQYESSGEYDKNLPFLCLFRLGEYANLGESPDKSYRIYRLLAHGLEDRLGAEHPMTMKATYHLARELLTQGDIAKGEHLLSINIEMQYRLLGPDHPDYVMSLEYLSYAQWHLNRFEESAQGQAEAQARLQRLWGPLKKEALKSKLFLGYALEAQRKLEEALHIFDDIWKTWLPVMGPDNPLALMAQCSIGAIYRKQRLYAKAEQHLSENLAARQRVLPLNVAINIDSGLQLALVYRETRCTDKAESLLDLVSSLGDLERWFERVCQISHVRALLCVDRGKAEDAVEILRSILAVARSKGREANNRELLWVRLTLADLLRLQSCHDEALSLFQNLVRPQGVEASGLLASEANSESQSQLQIAEQGLRLIRIADIKSAENLLKESKLEWIRPQDFWMIFGGEPIDTAWLNDPMTWST